jgi:uncharacterized membrane protein YeaQ/YmgE (transglycosylase-associated protein family)
MTYLTVATWIVVAVVTAWGASTVMSSGGRGFVSDMLLGLSASGMACEIAWSLEMFPEPGLVATALIAFGAAGGAIILQRRFFHVPLVKARARRAR